MRGIGVGGVSRDQQMRLDGTVRRCVVFLGNADREEDDSFRAAGTGFFLDSEGIRFIVTARHVAAAFGDDPFCIRVNRSDGTSDNVFVDPLEDPIMRWIFHTDVNVDLAVMPFQFSEAQSGLDMLAINGRLLLNEAEVERTAIGVGDMCYAIGLFRLLQGTRRNVPIVHTGHIALMAGEEPIPMEDWLHPGCGAVRHVNGYLVQMQNLRGLSGAPVLIRPSIDVTARRFTLAEGNIPELGGSALLTAYDRDVYVLGVWTGSWEAPPGTVTASEHNGATRVPVGLGTVVPAARLIELLTNAEVAARRIAWAEAAVAQNATP